MTEEFYRFVLIVEVQSTNIMKRNTGVFVMVFVEWVTHPLGVGIFETQM